MILSENDVKLLTGKYSAITKRQAELIGVGWPPQKGWKKSLVGRGVNYEDFKAATDIRSAREANRAKTRTNKNKPPKKKKRKRSSYYDTRKIDEVYQETNTKIIPSDKNKAKYRDKRWIDLKNEILRRDNYRCVNCGATDRILHVHHLCYEKGMEVWESPQWYLVTLCERCHKAEHSKVIKPPQKLF